MFSPLNSLKRCLSVVQASERQPRIGEDGIVSRRVVRAAQERAVEVARTPVEMQVLDELNADARVPGLIIVWAWRAVAEGDVGKVQNQAVPVRATGVTVVGRTNAVRRAERIVP